MRCPSLLSRNQFSLFSTRRVPFSLFPRIVTSNVAFPQDMLKELLEEMEEEDIPANYGGKLEGDVYSSREEQKLWRYVNKLGDQTS